jgi:hypothetical protein
MAEIAAAGITHWRALARQMIELHRQQGDLAGALIEQLILEPAVDRASALNGVP